MRLTKTSWWVRLPRCTHCTLGEDSSTPPQGTVTSVPLSAATSLISTSSAKADEKTKIKK